MAWSLPDGAVLALWCEEPTAESKPKLEAAADAEFAETVASAALLDRLDLWNNPGILAEGGRRVVVLRDETAAPWFDQTIPASYQMRIAQGQTTAQRVRDYFDGEFEDGAERVVLLFGECPTLDPTVVVSAFLCLEHRDLAIGPRTDGGIYLIGAKTATPPIFDGVDWDGPTLLAKVVERLAGTPHALTILPPWQGLDSPQDWLAMVGHLRALERAGTRTELRRLIDLVGR